jgi:Tol biopolymer transport system component
MIRYAAVAGVCLCVALIGADAAQAQDFGRNKVHYDRLDFRVLQTEHFDIYYYAEEEEATRYAGRMAERWYARFSQLLGHTFTRRQPLVLYASHPHFRQTNLTAGSPGEGTGGFTEAQKSRIAMPFAAGLGETDHVLGHEIAHAFQIDIAKSVKQNAFSMPGWFIEGMAEYLSLGEANAHTLMWVRDAARHDRLPSLDQLDEPRFFPYRYGHAVWSFLAGRYGDAVLGRALHSTVRGGAIARLEAVTGLKADELTAEWHASIGMPERRTSGNESPALRDGRRGRIHVAPALSPDGRYLMFLSERDRLSMDLFLSDVDSGAVVRKIVSTATDPHFDSLQYIHSAGAWDPSGRRFAMTALRRGNPVVVLFDVERGGRSEEIPLPDVSEIYGSSWSPDGTRIVVSVLKGGLSDLFLFTVATKELTRLTADAFADLHPSWSPDGRTIAFATDRFTSDLSALRFGAIQVGLLDLETGIVKPLLTDRGKQVSPQWSPDGGAVYFVSDRDGTSNVYRADLGVAPAAPRRLSRVTDIEGGVSGITATSPALAAAARAGSLAFSVFENGRHQLRTLSAAHAAAGVTIEPAPLALAAPRQEPPLPPADHAPTLAELLADPHGGLPTGAEFVANGYDDRLQLESVSQPFVGAATGNAFGGLLRASFGVTFGDLLRDRQLQSIFRVGTDVDDFAAQLTYLNRKGQWNWGITAGFSPSHFYGARRSLSRDGDIVTRRTTHLRYLHEWGGLAARYNIDAARRIELGAGVRRTGFEWQTVTRVIDGSTDAVSRELTETPAGRPVYLSEAHVAYVYDTAVTGPTSPVLGQRLRLQIEPALGGLSFADVQIDARRYFMPLRPVTIAARVEHVGRYGSSASDPRLIPLIGGLRTMVRGYDLRNFAADECGRSATTCSMLDELTGSRFALVNLEVRAPVLGLFTGRLDYGRLPIEALAFVDAGFLWTRRSAGGLERDRFRSAGAGARVNFGGFVFEMTAARPFDRTESDWTLSFLLRPGW